MHHERDHHLQILGKQDPEKENGFFLYKDRPKCYHHRCLVQLVELLFEVEKLHNLGQGF